MTPTSSTPLESIGGQFRIPGDFLHGEVYGSGHINGTYRVAYRQSKGVRRYIHQRINPQVFPHPDLNMANIQRVAAHFQAKAKAPHSGSPRRDFLTLVPTLAGDFCWIDGNGDYWRTYNFIEGAYTCDIARTPRQAAAAGAAFGGFLRDLADLPGEPLHVTIPDFHHTPKRLAALQAAAAADACGRSGHCHKEIDFILSHDNLAGRVVAAMAAGVIPERIIHNDTKLNNVLLDRHTHKEVCVVDLDTVMPGSMLFDFGDMVRSVVNSAAEDEPDLDKVRFRLDIFTALCETYLSATGKLLTAAEKDLLVAAGPLIALELGARFLTDYLIGDIYFKPAYDNHNLVRSRVQLKFLAEMERLSDPMAAVIERVIK